MNRYDSVCKMISDLDDEGIVEMFYFIDEERSRRKGRYIEVCETDEDLEAIQEFIFGMSDIEHIENLRKYIENIMDERGLYDDQQEETSCIDYIKTYFGI